MSTKKQTSHSLSILRRFAASLSIAALLASSFALGISAQNMTQKMKGPARKPAAKLTEDQRILHVLNRLGFGARPGDLERVKAMGVENYINQQLFPEKIDDSASEAKLQNLGTLRMTTAELYEKYPQPGQLLRQLQQRGALPADLAQARDNRVKGGANAAPAATGQKSGDAMSTQGTGEMQGQEMAKPNDAAKTNAPANNDANPQNNPEYRRALMEYYKENNLRPAQFLTGELQMSRILRAVYSERQLQEVMVDFWTNHFNVYAAKGADRWFLTSYDRDTIRPHTLGKFYDLLLADAQSPAMLFYLDNFQSVSPNAQQPQRPGGQRGALGELMRIRNPILMSNNPRQQTPQQTQQRRGINENYARELMELHTLGVEGGYTQKDVQEVARCFTGWTILQPRGGGAAAAALMGRDARDNAGKFIFRPGVHDNGEKNVLGHKIPAGGGMKDGLMVLDILAHHPATAKFIATKLVRRFVSDDPPPALVDRVAQTFIKTDGDIREVLKVVFFSPEFNSAEAYRAKVKRPFELAVSAVRTLGADTNGGPQFHQWLARMGQPLYGFQTPNGYSDLAENWVNTGALLERMNFGLALVSNRIPGTRVDLSRFVGDLSSKSVDREKLLDRFVTLIVGGEISPKTRETLLKQLSDQVTFTLPAMPQRQAAANVAPSNPFETAFQRGNFNAGGGGGAQQQQQLARVDVAAIENPLVKIAGLILGSPEFQRQ
ncbi:MAG: hypothetical protein QOG23_1805 [Blastocatellia bacterium]|jgi:uncharacterized protein (DUF1800 family)|nr:hypothetical protein [Blastocatellia bacterium]